ncbi:MAG: filamentous hemagglutinin, partial [Pseudomonadota bacterium]|nr:filamentous hemagglutinin [Pseudomonadota bacterium]
SKQKSLGVSVSLCIPPFCVGTSSGSVSASDSKVNSDYASVTEQSAIRAGDKGFDVDVKGDTDLKGGAITSTQQAIDDQRNRFETGGELTTSDIENKAEYKAKSASVNVGTSLSFDGALKPGGTSAGFGKDGDKAESMTLAAISDIAGNKDARTGDKEAGIAKIFDQEKVQKEIDAQTKITQQFGQLASKAVGDYAQAKTNEAKALRELAKNEPDESRASQLKAQAAEIDSQWGETGTLRLAAHTVIGGLTGGASGAAGAAAGTLTAPLVADALAKAGIEGSLATAITAAASTAAGAVVGGTTGAGTALNEVTNNYLSHPEIKRKGELEKAIAECKASGKACASLQAELNELEKTDRARDALLDACQGVSSTACSNARQEVRNFAAEIVRKGSADVIIGSDGRHTIREATGTMSGGKLLFETGKGTVSAIVDGYVDTLEMLADAVRNPAGAAEALREQAQQAKEAVQWAAENPEKFKEIAQAAEQRLRDGLAEALNAGDEKQVGLLLGAVLANFTPDPAKKAQAALHLIDEIALAKKAETLAKRSDIDNVRNIPTGTKGNWSGDANGKLEPKTGYLLDNGHAYITDAQGRVKTVEADLNGIRMDRNDYQQRCVGKCGDAGDEGGHLIAAILGGAGDRLNIVPQSQTLNRGAWRDMEKYLKQELDAGKTVTMKVEVGYPQGGGARPSEFVVLARIGNDFKRFEFTQ